MNDEQWLQGLREAARRDDAEVIPEDLARPLGSDFQARVLARVQAERAERAERVEQPEPVASPRAVVSIRRRVAGAVTALALAAAVILFVRTVRHGDDGEVLPDYVTVVGGNEQNTRGEPTSGGPRRYRPDSVFTMSVRPSRVTGPIEVRFARITAGEVAAIDVPHKVSPSGSLMIEARAGDVFGATPGSADLLVVICPSGRVPTTWLDLARRGADPAGGARILRESAEILVE